MVLGFFDGSIVIFALMKIRPAIVVVASSPLQTRFICFIISAGMAWPSAEPDTIDHSPCNWAMSFLTASFSAVQPEKMGVAAKPIRNAILIALIVVFDCLRWSSQRRIRQALKPVSLLVDLERITS